MPAPGTQKAGVEPDIGARDTRREEGGWRMMETSVSTKERRSTTWGEETNGG